MNVKFCDKTAMPITSCKEHSHKYWEIILHLTGTVTSVIGGVSYNISPGDIMIIPPNTNHNGISDALYTDMYFQCEDIDFSDFTLLHDSDGSILTLMNLLHKVFTKKDTSYKVITDDLFRTICSYLYKNNIHSSKYDFVEQLKNEIYENISNSDFHIADYVHNIGFNTDYTRRCFKEEMGITPLEYLIKLRLSYAKQLLLQETYISVVDVAEKCGFNDSFYFSKIFKQNYGVSPLNYRKSKLH